MERRSKLPFWAGTVRVRASFYLTAEWRSLNISDWELAEGQE